jgi:predicted nucleic acid-binding protein
MNGISPFWNANPDAKRRARVHLLSPEVGNIVMLTPAVFKRAEAPQALGYKPADAVHVAAAEEAKAEILLSCDDRYCRTAHRQDKHLRVAIRNPLEWVDEVEHAADSR